MEVYINGEWGTVCGQLGWDPLESEVVCRQLGYKGVKRTYSHTAQHNFGEGTGDSRLGFLQCNGSEPNLLECPHDDLVCHDHSYDVGVVCTNEDLRDGEYRCVDCVYA